MGKNNNSNKTSAANTNSDNWRPATRLVHGGTLRSPFGETGEGMFLTSGYVYESAEQAAARFRGEDDGYIYGRYGNPTVSMFEERVRLLEGAEAALATASGMAAVTASLLCQLETGDHVVAAKALFGSCRYVVETLLPQYGITSTLVDGKDLEAWEAAMRNNTKVVFLESPTNPTLELVDIAAVADIAHKHGAQLIVDNVFATPVLQKPLELGADIVCYSATKHMDGQGRVLAGIVLGTKDFIDNKLMNFLRQTGPSISPFNAWVILKGLETLPLRIEHCSQSAADLANYLGDKKCVTRLYYPGHRDFPQNELFARQMKAGSNLIALELAGDQQQTFAFMNALKIIKICNNLGDSKSLITHPTTTTHFRLTEEARLELGITPSMVRLSVGLEDAEDLKADIDQALQTADMM